MAIDGPVRIGLLGGECTGKTALAAALAESLPACVVSETLRDFVRREGRTPGQGEQRALMFEQQSIEDAAAASCQLPWLVADPAPLMTAIYSVLYFDDASLIAEASDLTANYGLLAWCDIDLPWLPDGIHRDGAEHRDLAHSIIARIVRDELIPRGITVVRASGPLPDRVAVVRRAWQPRGPHPPT